MDEREAMDRLRGADPAAGETPDEARLASLVEARRSEGEGRGSESQGRDELAARRSRRLAPVAAAVVAALAVGGAGFAVGRSVDDAPPTAEPAIGRGSGDALMDSAGPEMASPAIGYLGGGRMTFTSAGLSSQGGTAQVWAFDGASAYGEESAARAAEVLGVPGEPRQDEGGGGWSVGSNDGSGAFLFLMPDGMATVSFHDPDLYSFLDEGSPTPFGGGVEPGHAPRRGGSDGDDSATTSGSVAIPEPDTLGPEPLPEPDAGVGGPTAPPADGDPPGGDSDAPPADGDAPATDGPADTEPADPEPTDPAPDDTEPADPGPTGEEEPTAVEPDGAAPDGPAGVLYETLAALGIDPEAAEYETGDHWASDEVSLVTAYLVAGGERTGATWQAEIVDGVVYSFNGPLASVVGLGDYDVIGPEQAVERLSDPRFGHSDYLLAAGAGPVPELAAVRPWGTPPAGPPEPGAAVPWPVRQVTITGAEPVLTMTTTEDGVTLAVPAYSLSDSDGGTWTVVALAEHELAF